MRRIRRTLALVAASTGLVVGATGVASADVSPGRETTLPFLADRELHTGATVVTVPDQSDAGTYDAEYSLVGKDARNRWLVGVNLWPADQGDAHNAGIRVLAVSGAGTTRVFEDRYGSTTATAYFRLDRTRKRFLISFPHEGTGSADTPLRVVDLDGQTVATRTFVAGAKVRDFNGARVILDTSAAGHSYTRLWTIGTGVRTLVARGARFADTRYNALAVRVPRGVAYTSLSRPRKVRWTAPFLPLRISPDGKRVAGMLLSTTGEPQRRVQIRRVSDGHLIYATVRPGDPNDTTVGWEGNNKLVFQEGIEQYTRLVRATPPDRWWILASNDRPEPGLRRQDDPFGFPYDGQEGRS